MSKANLIITIVIITTMHSNVKKIFLKQWLGVTHWDASPPLRPLGLKDIHRFNPGTPMAPHSPGPSHSTSERKITNNLHILFLRIAAHIFAAALITCWAPC